MQKTTLALVLLFSIGAAVPASHAQPGDSVVILTTESGRITIELFPVDAPNHADNFTELAQSGFYDGTLFHRIIPGFMIQGGDPLTARGESTIGQWGTGGPDHAVAEEFNDIKHVRGIVSMARSQDPDSAGSQFFIVHADSPHLDGQYTAFGRMVTQESFDTLDRIASLETANTKPVDWTKTRIISADVVPKSEVPEILELGGPARLSSPAVTPEEQLYENKRLGIEFSGPVGWLIQEPQKTGPNVPDVVAVTSGATIINPSISVTIAFADGKSLDQRMDERRELMRPAIESGQLTITSEESSELHGRDVYAINAIGTYGGGEAEEVQFREITFLENDKFYAITYTTAASEFEQHFRDYSTVLETFKAGGTGSAAAASQENETNPDDSGCLIATAAYGSEMAPQVQLLREVRDNAVLATQSGSAFMAGFNQLYYSFSPTVADWERQNPVFKEAVRAAIAPLLATLSILNHAGIDSEPEMLGYGLGIIAMNVGIYLAAPAVIVHRILRRQTTRRRPPRQEPCTPSRRPSS